MNSLRHCVILLISDLLWFIFSNILQVLKDNFWHYFYQIDFRSFFLNTICIIVLGNILYYILNSVWNLGIRGIFNLTNSLVKALINICRLFTGFCEYKRKQRIENSTQNVERVIKKRNRSPKKRYYLPDQKSNCGQRPHRRDAAPAAPA